jgi:two-component system, LytTR family, sensor kinase
MLESLQYYITWKFLSYLLVYGLILGGYELFRAAEQSRARELAASRLQTQLVQAQLQLLKMQLQPHFLFNTLHAISALLHKDPALADKMIARLGELLRATLEHGGSQEVTLQQELDFVRPYLEIEQARFGPRLRVALEIDPEALDASVPSMILQPLVENAIRHGVAARPGPGRVEVRVRRVGPALQIQVCDDGPGLPPRFREGLGLTNTRARLHGLYGPAQELTLANGPAGGVVATLTLPCRLEPPAADIPEPTEDVYHSVGAR